MPQRNNLRHSTKKITKQKQKHVITFELTRKDLKKQTILLKTKKRNHITSSQIKIKFYLSLYHP